MNVTFISVPIAAIEAQPQVRTRFEEKRVRSLAASIEASGLQQPLLCARMHSGYRLIDGECRLRAAKRLGWTEIAILVVEDGVDEAEAVARQLVCNLQRTDLNPVEKARGIHELVQRAGLTREQAATKLGLSPSDVSRSLSLLKLPARLLDQVADGTIPPDAAYQLSRVADPAEQAVLAAEVAGKRLTRDALARKLRRVRQAGEATSHGLARVTAPLGDGRSVTVSGRGLDLETMIDWLEQLLSKAKKARSQGLAVETFVRALKDQAKGAPS